MLGRVHAELKVPHVRLSKDGLNVQDPRIAEQLHTQLRDPAKKHLWVSYCHVLQGALGIESA